MNLSAQWGFIIASTMIALSGLELAEHRSLSIKCMRDIRVLSQSSNNEDE